MMWMMGEGGVLCGHSDKLAIALVLCKNWRTSFKFISLINSWKTIMRDANKCHLIKFGVCSCGTIGDEATLFLDLHKFVELTRYHKVKMVNFQ